MNVPDPRVGTVLHGRYKILERRISGSMGVVYRGERVALNRPVAIKFLNEGYAATDDGRRRFEIEARAMSRLEHPNCVPVTDFGVDEGAPYLVMDFVSGMTLRELLVTEWRLAPARAVAIIRQVLAGVAHAHAQGIIHRDLKPENILITAVEGHGEHVRIVDFGLAKLRDEGSFTTGVAVGTPGYMSPEQTIGQRADERADVYACGIILYELLAGAKPFQGESPFEVMRMHRDQPPAPLSTAAAGVEISPRLEAVVMKALAKSRDDRFASASDFMPALERVDEAHGARRGRGNRTWFAAGAIGAIVIAGGAVLVSTQWGRSGADGAPAATTSAKTTAPTAEKTPTPTPAATLPVEAPPPPAPAPAAAAPIDAALPAPVDAGADVHGADPAAIARLRALASDDGDLRGAIKGLEALRAAQPADPAVHYALANLYAESQTWPQAVKSYAATLRLDPKYRTDPRLIGDVVEALGSAGGHELAAALIEHELGAAARPRLREASRSTNRGLRVRANQVLARLR